MSGVELRAQERFAKNLRELRHARGYSQDQLAAHAGFSRGHYGHMERGKHSPSLTTIVRLARALDASVHDLLDGID